MSDISNTGDFLEQYGVKGMKWGVRRSQAQLDRAAGRTPSQKRRADNRKVKSERNKAYKSIRTMSDEELKSRLDRSKMEKELKTLLNKDLYPGRTWLSSVANDITKPTATAAGKALFVQGVQSGLRAKQKKTSIAKEFNFVERASQVWNQMKKKEREVPWRYPTQLRPHTMGCSVKRC